METSESTICDWIDSTFPSTFTLDEFNFFITLLGLYPQCEILNLDTLILFQANNYDKTTAQLQY